MYNRHREPISGDYGWLSDAKRKLKQSGDDRIDAHFGEVSKIPSDGLFHLLRVTSASWLRTQRLSQSICVWQPSLQQPSVGLVTFRVFGFTDENALLHFDFSIVGTSQRTTELALDEGGSNRPVMCLRLWFGRRARARAPPMRPARRQCRRLLLEDDRSPAQCSGRSERELLVHDLELHAESCPEEENW